MNNIAENVFQAVDIIVNKKLEGLQFNRTEQATIIDDSNAEKGQYTVKTETVQYDAFSENTQYRNKQKVLVNIPNNNYDDKKIIIGLANEETEVSTIEIIDPISQMLDITGSLLAPSGKAQMIANDISTTTILIGDYTTDKDFLNGYSRVGISAQFQTLLGDYDIVKGRYGLILKLYSYTDDGQTLTTGIDFSNDYFYGNSYNMPGYQKQSMVADISKLKDIYKIELYFYQNKKNDKGTFINKEGNLIPYKDQNGNKLLPNLKVKSPIVCFGYDWIKGDDDKAVLYSNSGVMFNDNTLEKEIDLRWIESNNGQLSHVYNSVPENSIIRWYKKDFASGTPDNYVGYGWKILTDSNLYLPKNFEWDDNNGQFYSTVETDSPSQSNEYYTISGKRIYYTNNYIKLFNDLTVKEKMRYDKAEEKFKVVIFHEDNVIISDELIFTNQNEAIDRTTIKYSKGLSYHFDDNTNGRYSFYGPDGQILNQLSAQIERTITLQFAGGTLREAQQIIWDTSLVDKKMIRELKPYGLKDKDNEVQESMNVSLTDRQGTLSYKIGPYLNLAQAAQTYIMCTVVYNDETYTITIPFFFGRDSSLEYNLGLEICKKEDEGYIPIQAIPFTKEKPFTNNKYYIRPIIYQSNGEEATDVEKSNIKLSCPEKVEETLKVPNKEEEVIINRQYFKIGSPLEDGYYPLILNDNIESDKIISFNTSNVTLVYKDRISKTFGIPITSDENLILIGQSEILYNSAGYPPESRVGYSLVNIIDDVQYDSGINGDIANNPRNDPSYNPEYQYLPIANASNFGNQKNYLTLPNLYVRNLATIPSLTFQRSDGTILWSQPLIISIENYSSTMLNDWDGSLVVDKEKRAIMTRALGAGKLEKDNLLFSGVLLGDMADTGDPSLEKTGLYGYYKGEQVFAFKDDGSAFIGRSGSGRIAFDGEKAIIQSGNYEEKDHIPISGLKIDLDDGYIKAATLNLQDKLFITPNGQLYIDPDTIIGSMDMETNEVNRIGTIVKIDYFWASTETEAKKEENASKWKEIPPQNSNNSLSLWQRTRKIHNGIQIGETKYVNLGNAGADAEIRRHVTIEEDGVHISGYSDGVLGENKDKKGYEKGISYGEAIYTSNGIVFQGVQGNKKTELSRWDQEEMRLENLNKFSLGDFAIQEEANGSYSITMRS